MRQATVLIQRHVGINSFEGRRKSDICNLTLVRSRQVAPERRLD